jgi:hypothetical protein
MTPILVMIRMPEDDRPLVHDAGGIPQGLKRLRKNGECATNSRGAGMAGAEALVDFAAFAARLKSCPVTKQVRQRVFPQPLKPALILQRWRPD